MNPQDRAQDPAAAKGSFILFGYILVNKPELKIREFDTYRSYYCGLCHALKERHGLAGRMTLNYDMTFLVMILSDLYDLPEETKCSRCIVHPVHKHCSRRSRVSDYCADMCVLLSYYKMQDDWNDEHKFKALLAKALLKPKAKRVASNYPEKAAFIEKKMNMLTVVESARSLPIDKVAKVFGEILAEVFVYQNDYWKDDLYKIGFFLGKYIYLLDAYEDIEDDRKTGAYNPFQELYGGETFDDQVLNLLLMMIGECTDAFERLPLVENVEILRNILYSGFWVRYGKTKSERVAKSGKKDGKGEAEAADGSL